MRAREIVVWGIGFFVGVAVTTALLDYIWHT